MIAASQHIRSVYFVAPQLSARPKSFGTYIFQIKKSLEKLLKVSAWCLNKLILEKGYPMTEKKENREPICEYGFEDIQIIEESGGQFVRVCDPAEFGIKPRKKEPPKVFDPTWKRKPTTQNFDRQPIVIIEESFGKPVRVVDIAEINAIVKKQFNLG